MHHTKLHDYLQTFSPYELNRFYKYVCSPYFNTDEKIKHFVAFILPYAKRGQYDTLTNALMAKRFGSKGKYTRLLSDTVKKAELFLVTDRGQKQTAMRKAELLEIMNLRQLYKHIPEALSLATKLHKRTAYRDEAFLYNEYLLQRQRNQYLENRDERSGDKNLPAVNTALDVYYFTCKLKYFAAALHYGQFLTPLAEQPLFTEILAETSSDKYSDYWLLQVYRHIVLSYTAEQSEQHYYIVKHLLTQQNLPVDIIEQKTILAFAINYCIRQINLGNQNSLKELFSLYQYALLSGWLMDKGVLSPWEYKNITTVALRLKEYRWVASFLTEYKNLLPQRERDNAYTFNYARYCFYIRKYDKVLQALQQVQYSDIFYQLDAKTTLLKTYYELGEWQSLYSLKDSFRILLRRKKHITGHQKQNYLNLLRFTLRLFRCDVKKKKEMAALRHDIHTTQNVADKSWLMEKLNELT